LKHEILKTEQPEGRRFGHSKEEEKKGDRKFHLDEIGSSYSSVVMNDKFFLFFRGFFSVQVEKL
jgi:hypothetical protein